MARMDLDLLRGRLRDSLAKHLFKNAIFLADKIVSLGGGAVADVVALAQAYIHTRQHKRALHVLQAHGLPERSLTARYLAAKCLLEARQREECLELLGEDDLGAEMLADDPAGDDQGGIDVVAAIYHLRGLVYESMENRKKASFWFCKALERDVYCYEALDRIVDNYLLTAAEEQEFLKRLPFRSPDDDWLRVLYESKLARGHSQESLAEAGAAHGLGENPEFLATQAEIVLARGQYQEAHDRCKAILQRDPFQHNCMPTYICSLVELRHKNDLFYLGHKLVDEYPNEAVSWFAVGCYYYVIENYPSARRYFGKATSINNHFAPAWLGFGHTFATQDESDQAMAAYRTSSRLFIGSHLPLLFIGMEHMRTNNLGIAKTCFDQALALCDFDPLIHNELGVLCFKNGDYASAIAAFERVLELAPPDSVDIREPAMFNMGHAMRKQKRFDDAIRLYEGALALCPRDPSVLSALGFAHHLKGDLDAAITHYEKALGIRPEDVFTTEMLRRALASSVGRAMIGL